MNKQILGLTIILSIALLSIVSAETIYSGESKNITLPEEYDYYSIVGNTSEVDLTLESNGKNVTITLGKYNPSDTFTIIFFNKEKEVIVEYKTREGSTNTVYVENETIKYVEVDNYIDRIIYKENDTAQKDDEPSIIDDIHRASWSWWYAYVTILVIFAGGIYLWIKYVRTKEEEEDEDV